MGPFAAAALSFGAQLFGGHLSREAAKKERKNHFVNLRDSATRAGFNPLTALYATGGGGYGQYVGLISRNPLGDAVVAGSNAYTAGAARREQMGHDRSMQNNRFAHETSLQDFRLDHDKRMNALLRQTVTDGYPKTDRANSIQIKPPKIGRPNPQGRYPNYIMENIMIGEERVPNQIRISEKNILEVDKNVTSAENLEARYGDGGVSWLLNANVLWQDYKKTWKKGRDAQRAINNRAALIADGYDFESGNFFTLPKISRKNGIGYVDYRQGGPADR